MVISVAIGVISGRLSQATGRSWTVIIGVVIIGVIILLVLEVTGQVGVKIMGMAYMVTARMFSRAMIYGVIGGSILGVLVKKVVK